MKKMHKSIIVAIAAVLSLSASAQQVTTLYFLENAPMRHTINPAFQPVSRGYLNFSPIGWINMGAGNNSYTIRDLIFPDPSGSGQTITALHPNADREAFLNQMQRVTYVNGDITFSWFNVGSRTRKGGFFAFGINQKIESGATIPKDMLTFFLDGGMKNLQGINNIALGGLGGRANVYTEISAGYSRQVNEHWTIGGKLKLLLGQVQGMMNTQNLAIDASVDQWHIHGDVDMDVTGPVNSDYLDGYMVGRNLNQVIDGMKDGSFDTKQLFTINNIGELFRRIIVPAGYGAALDFGIAWKPIEQLQVSAAFTDLGFIYWAKGSHYRMTVDTTYVGAGNIDYSDPAYRDADGNFSTQILMDTVVSNLKGLLNGARISAVTSGPRMMRMTSARLNVGIDANFWDNRVGVGIVSATKLYNSRLYEEVTIGVSFRPVNWFNIAASYSLMNNGKYSNIGAGLSFMPYDGINLTLLMDYIPTSYAAIPNSDPSAAKIYAMPDKTKMFNLALGFSICWGTNKRDKDKDGVWDKLDKCPQTPRGVMVDDDGCPMDVDADGVPDYRDNCLDTPEGARVDENGCTKYTN